MTLQWGFPAREDSEISALISQIHSRVCVLPSFCQVCLHRSLCIKTLIVTHLGLSDGATLWLFLWQLNGGLRWLSLMNPVTVLSSSTAHSLTPSLLRRLSRSSFYSSSVVVTSAEVPLHWSHFGSPGGRVKRQLFPVSLHEKDSRFLLLHQVLNKYRGRKGNQSLKLSHYFYLLHAVCAPPCVCTSLLLKQQLSH